MVKATASSTEPGPTQAWSTLSAWGISVLLDQMNALSVLMSLHSQQPLPPETVHILFFFFNPPLKLLLIFLLQLSLIRVTLISIHDYVRVGL